MLTKNALLVRSWTKEIHNLKWNIIDFKRNIEYLNYVLKICITDSEGRLNKEKKLRKFIETDLEELKEQEQRRPGCRASSCTAHRVTILNLRATNLNHRQETVIHFLNEKTRWNHRTKEKSTSLLVPKLNVEKQEKNDEGNSHGSINKRQPVGRKDSTKSTQTKPKWQKRTGLIFAHRREPNLRTEKIVGY